MQKTSVTSKQAKKPEVNVQDEQFEVPSLQNTKLRPMREKYQTLERISEGNFGTVYKVKELRTSQIYAMKKIIASTKNRANFIREIEILSQIHHENVSEADSDCPAI